MEPYGGKGQKYGANAVKLQRHAQMSGKEGDFFFFNVFVAVALELMVIMSI